MADETGHVFATVQDPVEQQKIVVRAAIKGGTPCVELVKFEARPDHPMTEIESILIETELLPEVVAMMKAAELRITGKGAL